MNRLLEVKNLFISFGEKRVLEEFSFSLEQGMNLGIVGESGSGKSVMALSLLRLLDGSGAKCSGEILYMGKDTLKMKERELRGVRGGEIGMVFQEPLTSLNPLHKVYKQIAESVEIHQGLFKKEAKRKAYELLELVGLGEERILNSYPFELSGGQRQRVVIAIAIANNPKILIADEPTTALDVTIEAQILELLKDLQDRLNMAMIFISHDLNIVRRICDDVIVMKEGIALERGSAKGIFENPKEKYTKMLTSDFVLKKEKKDRSDENLLKVEELNVVFGEKRDIFFRKIGGFKALKNVNFTVGNNHTLGIVGESGSGKSTIAQAVLRLIKSSGKIELNGVNIESISQKELRALRSEMQVVFQDPFSSLSPRMSIGEIVAEGLVVFGNLTKKEREEEALKALKEVGIESDALHRYPHEFSGGQRQRISIARALILKPKLIILDEPTSALDRAVQFQVLTLLESIQKKFGISYIFISHDLRVIEAICDDVIVLKDGEIIERGSVEQIYKNPQNEYTKELIKSAFLS